MHPNVLYRTCGKQLAALYDPITIMACMTLYLPVQWKGGDVHTLVKDPLKPHCNIRNRRDIWLADKTPKVISATQRGVITQMAKDEIVDS